MRIENHSGIKHIIINDFIKNEEELYNVLENKVFVSPYLIDTFYPVVVNNKILFAYKNQQGYMHFYIMNKKYRFNRKKEIVYDSMIIEKNHYRRLLKEVRKSNLKIFKGEN